MKQTRQLAAVMFTDIVGYTALMQQDERKAFEVLKKNLAIHQSAVNEFGGRIIKELGDGILTAFSNVSDAVNAAIKIQEYCYETKSFDLSIGIHQGEVVFENGDIFGDAVNVASRIQSLGTPGSILFSKKIMDELKNKSEFRTVSMGHFEFKNVNESIEVFALANEGFAVPVRNKMKGKLKKSPYKKNVRIGAIAIIAIALVLAGYNWFSALQYKREVSAIRNGSIAILPFENQTGRTDLNLIGQVAADYISTNLIQNQFWKVIPVQDVFRQTVYSGVVTNPEAERKITAQSNVDYLVIGHYNLIGDSVLLVVSVNDVVENKILFTTPIIRCSITDPIKAVIDAQQFVLGFLMFSTKKESTTTRPPKYDAYKEYLKGMAQWALNDMGPGSIGLSQPTDIESYYYRAIALDPDFLPPYFQLTELFSLTRRFKGLDSVLQILEPKQYLFLESDSMNFMKQKLLRNKDWSALEKLLLSKVEKGNTNLRPYYELAVNALYRQNRPKKALEYIALSDLTQYDFDNKPADQLLYFVEVSALDKLGRVEDIEKLVSSFRFQLKIPGIQYMYWKAIYVLHGHKAAISSYELNPIPLANANAGYYAAYFRYCQIQNDTSGMRYFFNRFLQYPQDAPGAEFLKSVILFRTGDTDDAEKLLSKNLPTVDRQRRIHMLGLLYAVTGRRELAQKTIEDLLSHETEFDNGVSRYYVAKIEAEMGNKESCIRYLKEAIARGIEFRQDLFEFDADLKTMFDYPAFIDLVTPKE